MRSAHAEWAVLLWCFVPTCGATAAASEETTQPRAVQWLCFRCSPRKYRQRRRELQLAQLQDHLLPLLAAIWTEVAVSSAGLGLMTTLLAERRKRASRARVAGGDGLRTTCSRSGSYRSQPYRRWSDSGRHGRCIRSSPAAMGCHRTGSQAHLPPLGVMANRRVPRP